MSRGGRRSSHLRATGLAAVLKVRAKRNVPRTQPAQTASSNRHLALATSSFKLPLASPASSSALISETHSVSSLSVLSSQCPIVAVFVPGGTKDGRGGGASLSAATAKLVEPEAGEWVEEERLKNWERRVT